MNWLKKGPELKLPKLRRPSLGGSGLKVPGLKGGRPKGPDLKPPGFVADLYYDLRDRRLLPLVVLVLVAIAAVPFLMGSDPEPLPSSSAASGEAGGGVTAEASSLTVVEATPGLRDYKNRLRGRSATDPFVQQYANSGGGGGSESEGSGDANASSAGGEVGGSGSSGAESEPAPTPDGGSSPGSGGSGGGSGSGDVPPTSGRFYAYRPNVRFGVAGSDDLTVHEHLPLGKLLPQKNAILVFIGASENGNQVAFNLTREVTSVRGPGRCVGGKDDCSLLILRAGQAVDLVTEAGQTFRLHVVQIDFVEVERPKPAGSSSARRRNAFDRFQSFIK